MTCPPKKPQVTPKETSLPKCVLAIPTDILCARFDLGVQQNLEFVIEDGICHTSGLQNITHSRRA
jgi:hypothetical protein